jgi:low temperature requirement protein LtrA
MAVGERVTGDEHHMGLLRDRAAGGSQTTSSELFFDLVYVFAVTQLSHLLNHLTIAGALQPALLLAMVWLVWVYTTWVTNGLDPNRLPIRLLLVGLMLVSLVLSAGLPEAFAERGLWVGGAYAVMQIGRSAFTVAVLRGERLKRNFQRILAWCAVSGAQAVADELTIAHPNGHTGAALTAVVLSGPALLLAGHALFKWAVFNRLSIPRLLALLALAALVPVSLIVPPLALAGAATAIVVAVAVADTYSGQHAVSSLA